MSIEEIKVAVERALSEGQVFAKAVHDSEAREQCWSLLRLIRRELKDIVGEE